MGAFENEIMLWLHNLRQWIYRHERFTWINLVFSIIPSPVCGLFAIILASLQLYLCSKGKIPKTEKMILLISLLLGFVNLILTSILIFYLIKEGFSFWHIFNPFLWFGPLNQKIFNHDTIYTMANQIAIR